MELSPSTETNTQLVKNYSKVHIRVHNSPPLKCKHLQNAMSV